MQPMLKMPWLSMAVMQILLSTPVAAQPTVDFESLRAEGSACYRRRDYRCALSKFETAFALRPSAAMRFNVASARDKLGQYALAVRQYQQYLKEAGLHADPQALLHIQRRLRQLLRRVARLQFSLSPTNAQVKLDGAVVDLAANRTGAEDSGSYEVLVDPGIHKLQAAAEGYLPFQKEFDLRAGQVESLAVTLAVPPLPTTGTLDISSTPAGAYVWIDGKRQARSTPLQIAELAPGAHLIKLATSSLSYQTSVEIEAGKRAVLAAELRPHTVQFECASDPPGAQVILDGSDVGTTPLILDGVAAGPHLLEMLKPGYRGWQQSLQIAGWSPDRLHVRGNLEAAPAAPSSPAARPRAMTRPLAGSLLPLETAALQRLISLYSDLTNGTSTAYTLGLEARFSIRDRLELGFNLPLVSHGLFAAAGDGEKTALGDLRLMAKAKLLGASQGQFVLSGYLHGSLPTTTLELSSRGYTVLRPGLAVTAQLGALTVGGDLAVQAEINPGDNWVLLPISASAAWQLGRWVSAQLAAQVVPALKPQLADLAVTFSPALGFSPMPSTTVAAGVRIAATDAGRYLLCRGASRVLLLLSATYLF